MDGKKNEELICVLHNFPEINEESEYSNGDELVKFNFQPITFFFFIKLMVDLYMTNGSITKGKKN
jgi:hypothetical protein